MTATTARKGTTTSILSNEQLLSPDTLQFDFEEYALKQGIPDLLDPLPYRKAGSVFDPERNVEDDDGGQQQQDGGGYGGSGATTGGGGDTHQQQLTSAKNDPRLRTVVCRHWLRDLCMKGSSCEFLHQYDLSKMPLCRHGDKCKIADCPFRHISDANRLDCVFYSQGFCIHGPFCRYRHVQRERQDLPAVADFTLGLTQMQQNEERGGQDLESRPTAKPNENYKTSLCKHFMSGSCPFGEKCHFAHGQDELRAFPTQIKGTHEEESVEDTNAHTTLVGFDYFHGGASGGGKPNPVVEPEKAKFFIVQASTQADLAISTVRGEWYTQKKHSTMLNDAYNHGKTQVMIFFTVSDSRHIQGAALMTSEATMKAPPEQLLEQDYLENQPDPEELFSYSYKVEWYRTAEFPITVALEAAPDLILPTPETSLCQEMSNRAGEQLMKAVWNAPLVTLYESWSENDNQDPPAMDQLLTDFRCPPPDEVAWPVSPQPGFIFGCSSDTMDECLGRGMFGMPKDMWASAQHTIAPGSTIFLFNVTDRLLFGIFEALTPALLNIEPKAFSKNPNATSSPFPVQVRVRVSLECPPLEDTDDYLNDILRSRGKSRIGPLTYAQTEAIASLLADQCGALSYMLDYQDAVWDGRNDVAPPPIALPPRKIQRLDS